jgi:DNA-binding transcriptional LysR family regulator
VDTLAGIKVFRQVVESGSFVAAAERLEISTAMVSKHVMQVEKRLGVRLLNRNSRTLSLTERAASRSSTTSSKRSSSLAL